VIVDAGYLFDLIFNSCTSLIGNAVSSCDFRTLQKGQPVKGAEYYLLNVRPNMRQNAPEFWREVVHKLYRNNEVLIVEYRNHLIIADSFNKTENALFGDTYSQVTVGTTVLPKTYHERDVMHLALNEAQVSRITRAMAESYRKILEFTAETYQKSRGSRFWLEVDAARSADKTFRDRVDTILNRDMKRLYENANATAALYKGFTLHELGSKTYSSEGTRDIWAMIGDVTTLMCRAFGIPPKLMTGDIAGIKEAVDQLLTFCVDPLCMMIEAETNSKRYTPEEYLEGTKLMIDTKSIKHLGYDSIGNLATNLVSNGWSVNEVRSIIREPLVDEPWANQHLFTNAKNAGKE